MSLLLFIVGAVALMVGVAMAAYGIPINEFSFGNTMIVAGCSLAAGGLIVIGLGAVVAQLQRMGEILSVWTPGRSPVADVFEDRGGLHPVPSENRIPFPPRPQPVVPPPAAEPDRGAGSLAAAVTTMAAAPAAADLFAGVPSLRNPVAPAEDEKEEAPATPSWLTARDTAKEEPSVRLGRTTNFDSMWPDKRASAEPPAVAPEPEPESGPVPETAEDGPVDEQDTAQYEAHDAHEGFDRQEPEEMAEAARPAQPPDEPETPSEEAPADAPQAAAVLKSGVVDGMAYTLYVDGSIEAELPQGTLRFSSINDLRNYLENNA